MAGQTVTPAPRAQLRPAALPSGLGWDATNYPLTGIRLLDRWGAPFAALDQSAESLFDAASAARSAPTTTYYVATTGSDSNNGLTSGAAVLSIGKAIQLANATGSPAKVIVAAGTYYRANNITLNNSVFPSVDIALIASGGRVATGVFDAFTAPSKDATYTNAYSWSRSNVNRVLDLATPNRFGNASDLLNVGLGAICNVTPGSWCQAGGTLYVNRADGAAVTYSNTRVTLGNNDPLATNGNAVNLYLGGADALSGFDLVGGQNGAFRAAASSVPASRKVLAANNCSFSFAGGLLNATGKGVSIDDWHGLAAFFNCRADANASDGFNFHRSSLLTGGQSSVLTVNCSAWDNGRAASQSNNGWTSHEDVIGIDLAGDYRENAGGSCRSVGTSKSLMAGTYVERDRGDLWAGGAIPPTAFMVDETATYWLDAVQVDAPAATRVAWANGAGASVLVRNPWPSRAGQGGAGTIGTW